MKYKC